MAFMLATRLVDKSGRAAVIADGLVYDAVALTGRTDFSTVRAILADWPRAQALLEAAAAAPQATGQPLQDAFFLAALPEPGTIFCAGANYQDHVDNMARTLGVPPGPSPKTLGLAPFYFIKSSGCVVGPDAAIPRVTEQLDYEAELAAVIGRPARNVSVERALEFVAGYMIANDMSARDRRVRAQLSVASPFHSDWLAHKNFDAACPLGPLLVPASQVPNPQDLSIRTWINEEVRQDAHSSGMIYTIAELIAYLSRLVTLRPGDVILSGTPAGVAAEDGQFLRVGDRVRIEIEGLGSLSNHIIEDA